MPGGRNCCPVLGKRTPGGHRGASGRGAAGGALAADLAGMLSWSMPAGLSSAANRLRQGKKTHHAGQPAERTGMVSLLPLSALRALSDAMGGLARWLAVMSVSASRSASLRPQAAGAETEAAGRLARAGARGEPGTVPTSLPRASRPRGSREERCSLAPCESLCSDPGPWTTARQ